MFVHVGSSMFIWSPRDVFGIVLKQYLISCNATAPGLQDNQVVAGHCEC